MDVASEESIKAAAEEIKKLAPDGINELWNNAARNGVKGPVTEEIDPKEWLAEFQTNVIGQSIVTRLLLPLLRKSQNAKVIFMSSGCGSVTERTGDDTLVVYSCTKAALDMTVKVGDSSWKKSSFAQKALLTSHTVLAHSTEEGEYCSDRDGSWMVRRLLIRT